MWSTIRPTFLSFHVFSSMMCEDFICFEQSMTGTWKKNGSSLEGFKVHNTNCENNCVLDFKVEPLGGTTIKGKIIL